MQRRMAVTVLSLSAAAIILTACSSSGSASSNPSSASSTATSASSTGSQTSDATGVAAAKAFLAQGEIAPTSIGVTTPLLRKPATGKLIVNLLTDTPGAEIISEDEGQAAAALGWQYKAISIGNSATGIQTAFDSALALKPAPFGITTVGYPSSEIQAQLKEAQSKGILVVDGATTDPATPPVIANINDGPQQGILGKDLAAVVVADSDGDAHVATFNISAFPLLAVSVTYFNTWLKTWCPACTNTIVNEQITDIGTTAPQSVVNTFESDPSLQYALYTYGDISLGVDAALKTAGLLGKVKQIGQDPTLQDLADLKNKTALAYIGYDNAVFAWRMIDAFARASEGMSLAAVNNVPLPRQILTQQNIGSMEADQGGNFLAPADYQAQFEKLWHV